MEKQIDYPALGKRIRMARKANGISQEQLGELCSISTAHIGHIERGTRIPSLETLFKISSVLHVTVDSLLFDSCSERVNFFENISARLEGKDGDKVKVFLSAVKALADKIDEL